MPTPRVKAKGKEPQGETQEEYRQRIMDVVCDLIARGQTLRRICDAVEIVPTSTTLFDWMDKDENLLDQYASARARQADYFADEIIDIADNEPDPQVARVRMDARKWHASKTAPKKYGDRIELDNKHSGAIGVPELNVYVNGVISGSIASSATI